MPKTTLRVDADRYHALRELVCGPFEKVTQAAEIAEAMTGGAKPTPDQFDAIVDAVIHACLTE
jgi:hypothetical protein